MVEYSDDNADDVNPSEDNYWAFVTGVTMTNDPASIAGIAFKPSDFYETETFSVRDGSGITSGDYAIAARNSVDFHPNDGMAFNGNAYQVERQFMATAEVRYIGQDPADPPLSTTVVVQRIMDPNNNASTPLHSTLVVRFRDNLIPEIYEGPDGPGGAVYPLKQIESLTINGPFTERQNMSIENAYDDPYPAITCYCAGTEIETATGVIPIEDLQIGNRVWTKDNGYQPIRWVGSSSVTADDLSNVPKLRPICIRAGALGAQSPARDLFVSPQHRILVRSQVAQRMFGSREVLVAAKQLLDIDGIDVVQDDTDVSYFHLFFDSHEVIYANGAEAESLYPGPEAIRALGPDACAEIRALFPELGYSQVEPPDFPAARPLVKGARARKLVSRLTRNGLEMVS